MIFDVFDQSCPSCPAVNRLYKLCLNKYEVKTEKNIPQI